MKIFSKMSVLILLLPIIIMGSAIFAKATGPIVNSVTIMDDDTGQNATATSVLAFNPSNPLLITKSPSKTELTVGETVSYTIQVKNVTTDGSTYTNITLTDDYPQDKLRLNDPGGITGETGFSCSGDADKITCNAPSLAPNETVEFTANFTAIAPGTATNIANVEDADGNKNNISTDINIIDAGNPLLMTNVPDNGNIDINDEVVFTTVISNTSSDNDLSDVTVVHTFPNTLLEFVEADPPPGTTCTEYAETIDCTTATLTAGDSVSIDFRFTAIDSGLATIQSELSEPSGNTFLLEAAINILDLGDLFYITKEPNRAKVKLGENVIFTATIRNRSDTQTLNNISIVDDFPEDILFLENVTADGIDCQKDAAEIRCGLDSLAPLETVTIISRYLTVNTGQAVNTIDATAELDQNGAIQSSVVVEDPGTIMRVQKSPSKTNLVAGEQIDYTIGIENTSDTLTLRDIQITDTFPTNLLQIESVSPGSGMDCIFDVASIDCVIDTLIPGDEMFFTSTFTTLDPGLATNQVNAVSESGQKAQGKSSVIIQEPGNPFLLSKISDKQEIEMGEEIFYTIEVQNTHTAALQNITLTDEFPEDKLQFLGLTRQGFTCTNTDQDITCTADTLDPGETKSITTRYLSVDSGTATNTVTVTDDSGNRQVVSENVIIEDVGNVFLVSKSPSKGTIEIGEEVDFLITITNRTGSQIVPNVNIIDDFPETQLELISATADPGLICQSDFSEIRCNIQDMQPGSRYTLNTRFKGIKTGTATNFLTITSDITEPDRIESSVLIVDPTVKDLELSSTCEAQNVLIGQKCFFQVIANYANVPPVNVSEEAIYLNFQSIGTMLANIFTATKTGTADVTAMYDGMKSNIITIKVIKDLGVGLDPDGNIIKHYAARTSGGANDTINFDETVLVGTESGGFNVVAENNRLIFSGIGGAGVYHWFLEDRTMGTIRDLASNDLCPDTGFGATCDDSDAVVFESGETQGSVLLQVYDDDGNKLHLTIHIVAPSIERIEIRDKEGRAISEVISTVKQENIPLTAHEVFADESVNANAEDELIWEYSFNGGEWQTDNEKIGYISRGILSPLATGTYAIRAKKTQKIALPGEAYITEKTIEIISDEITVQVEDAIPYIDSMRTAGNEGFAQGTADTLFARIRHIDGVQQVGDIELSLIRGEYADPDDIPESAQYFFIDPLDVSLGEDGQEKSVLAEIGFAIPILDDIGQGMHTLVLTITSNEGLPEEDVITGVLSIFIGEPQSGDADLNGAVDLVDAVITMRIIAGTETPTTLQDLALDIDGENGIAMTDYISIFRALLRTFLQ